MKALTIQEPYATLITIGAKEIETRSWSTTYRGPLAIHAAKTLPGWAADLIRQPGPIRTALFRGLDTQRAAGHYYSWDILGDAPIARLFPDTRGHVVAVAQLFDCVRVDGAERWNTLRFADGEYALTVNELTFGDFSPGRYAWILRDVRPLPVPVPAKGVLGLWDIDDAVIGVGR